MTGAFLLGILLELLSRRGPDHGRRRALRLFLGTGLLGGFTTYSALANDTAVLVASGNAVAGISYGLGTLFVGALAAWGGIALGILIHRRQQADLESVS